MVNGAQCVFLFVQSVSPLARLPRGFACPPAVQTSRSPDEPSPDEPSPDELSPDEPSPDEPSPDEPSPDELSPDALSPEAGLWDFSRPSSPYGGPFSRLTPKSTGKIRQQLQLQQTGENGMRSLAKPENPP